MKDIRSKYIYKPISMFEEYKIIPGKAREKIEFVPIEICNRCNLSCPSCGYSNRVNCIKDDITFEKFKTIIKQLPDIKYLDLSLIGEPLLSIDLPKIVKFATSKCISTVINTNGTLFRTRLLPVLEAGLGRLHISVDAANPRLFEQLRRGAKFDLVKENIKYAVDLVRTRKFNTVITFNTAVSRTNYKELPSIVKLAAELGVKEITVEGIHQWGLNKIDPKISFFRMTKDEVLPIFDEAIKLAIKNKIDLSLPPIDRLGKEDNLKEYLCFWPWDSANILANGDVVPCCIGVFPDVIFGNVFKQSFHEIWHSKKYQDFRDKFMKGELNDACSTCQMLLSFGLKRSDLSKLIKKLNN